MTTTTCTVAMTGMDPIPVSVTSYGSGRPFLLLHGGAGPQSMTDFGERLASQGVQVLVPVHPGFGGTPRPDTFSSIQDLAGLYAQLIEQLDLEDVTVVGNSIGGWITAELALLRSARVSAIVLIDAVGIEVPGHPVADFFGLTMDEVFRLSFHDPEPFRIDPSALPPAAQAVMAGNRAALTAYAGKTMSDPGLAARLATLELPVLVLWGDSDQIADPAYGLAYAAAIPEARYQLLADTGHMPQQETPDKVLRAISDTGLTARSSAATPGAGA